MKFQGLETAIRATKASINKKWKRLASGKFRGKEEPDCALCGIMDGCKGCPVRMVSGKDGCEETPYTDYDGGPEDVSCITCPYNYTDGDGTCDNMECPPPTLTFNQTAHVDEAKKELAFLKAILAGLEKMRDELKEVK